MMTQSHVQSEYPVVSEAEGKALIDSLEENRSLSRWEWTDLIRGRTPALAEYLFERARKIRIRHYGKKVYIRGLIEFTNYCRNDCYYCGIRKSNKNAVRYRLTRDQILSCCEKGYRLGFRTFVLQGGEDGYYTDEVICDIIREIKRHYPDCAVTLSLGERGEESFRKMYEAGADRYLLRHETANPIHYAKLHPEEMSLDYRKKCLFDLKKIGYQTGCGIMVGSPFQTTENILEDIRFMQELKPHMIGIGPFIHHRDTPFGEYADGSVELTLRLLSILRLIFPKVLLPATTALGTKDPFGREKGILAGANVVMPNLSPVDTRKKYSLYENKICTDSEAAENLADLRKRINAIGYEIAIDRGDSLWT